MVHKRFISFNYLSIESSLVVEASDLLEFDEALLNAVDFAFYSLGKPCQATLYPFESNFPFREIGNSKQS